jgi:hypothetical protein
LAAAVVVGGRCSSFRKGRKGETSAVSEVEFGGSPRRRSNDENVF